MYKNINLLIPGNVFLLLFIFLSCSTSVNEDKNSGIYEIEIEKSGAYTEFLLSSYLDCRDGIASQIYSEEGERKGNLYTFSEAENKAKRNRFYTSPQALGLNFSCSTLKVQESPRDSMSLFITGYFNGKRIVQQKHTFYSYTEKEIKEMPIQTSYIIQLSKYK